MKILCYRMFFHENMVNALDQHEHEYIFCSSERRMDESGLIEAFYTEPRGANLSEQVLNSVILRCRFLSGINYKRAREYVRRMWLSAQKLYDAHEIELVLLSPVDNYVMDILCRIASEKNIPAFQPREAPLSGLSRITNSCDHPELRVVTREEATKALDELRNNFKAHYQDKSKKDNLKIVKRMLREAVKKPVFEFWKRRYNDPLSFHYNTIFPNENAITVTSFKQLKANEYFKSTLFELQESTKEFSKVIFWPLSMTPESAINYLNKDHRLSDYKELILRIVEALPNDWALIVKEHPSAIGYRPLDQYDIFEKTPNIFTASMDVTTSQIIQYADAVLLNTAGTTGLEAAALGKNVLSIGSCHYKHGDNIKEISDFDKISTWPSEIKFDEITEEARIDVIQNYLRNTIPDATWGPEMRPRYEKRIRTTVNKCVELVRNGYVPKYFEF